MHDFVGIGIRARHEADHPAMMRATEILGADGGTCGVFGDPRWFSPAAAALMNGALAIHLISTTPTLKHPFTQVRLSSRLPLPPRNCRAPAEKDVITSIVAGYEVVCRLGQALGPDDHYERGYHPTATCGAASALR